MKTKISLRCKIRGEECRIIYGEKVEYSPLDNGSGKRQKC